MFTMFILLQAALYCIGIIAFGFVLYLLITVVIPAIGTGLALIPLIILGIILLAVLNSFYKAGTADTKQNVEKKS